MSLTGRIFYFVAGKMEGVDYDREARQLFSIFTPGDELPQSTCVIEKQKIWKGTRQVMRKNAIDECLMTCQVSKWDDATVR